MTLAPEVVEQAVKALSRASGFWFTRRCLMFELCRRSAWPDPGTYGESGGESGLDACERDFAEALAEHERRVGQLPRLVRPEDALAGIGPADLETFDLPADLFDYSIQRVAVFQRKDLCLMLIANGMHREIELALTVAPDFPTHVWARVRAQLDAGLRTTFLAVHDCGAASEAWLAEIEDQLGAHEGAEVFGVGLTVPWAFRLRVPVRGPEAPRGPGPSGPGGGPESKRGPGMSGMSGMPRRPSMPGLEEADPSFEPMLRSGSYALLEELTPLRAMRWIYGRVARGAEDVGFG
jgi:hypothetical protein